jgi:bifunctional non-homologous end joining protein LigD
MSFAAPHLRTGALTSRPLAQALSLPPVLRGNRRRRAQVLRAARDKGLEGIVSKRRSSAYRSGRVDSWRKTKCTMTDHFAVIGVDPPRGPVRSIKLARLDDGELAPCGSAGSGLSEADGRELRSARDAGRSILVEIEYRDFTPAGELRHPVLRVRFENRGGGIA